MPRKSVAQQLQLEAVLAAPQQVPEHAALPTGPQRVRTNGSSSTGRAAAARPLGLARRPAPEQLLRTPGALLTRSHLRELGLERRAIDAVFRALPVVAFPGYSRPMVRAEQFLDLVEQSTYRDDRVRPCHA
jgi:hypothetical protein